MFMDRSEDAVVETAASTIAAAERQIAAENARQAEADLYRSQPAFTATGERVHVTINVDGTETVEGLDPTHVDGIGLTRTELLFANGLPDEETQLSAYRRLLDWADGRPVIVRTLDAGGDKPVPGLTPVGEANPFLGVRGVRLLLAHPENSLVAGDFIGGQGGIVHD